MLEAWTNVFADPGTRTTGTGAGEFAIVGSGWHASSLRAPKSFGRPPTSYGSSGAPTAPVCRRITPPFTRSRTKLVPPSAHGKPYTPPPGKVDPSIDMKTPPREQVERMDTISYFKLHAELMKQNPPYAEDAPILARLARIGLVPGQDFDASKLASVPSVQDVPKLGVERILAHFPASGVDLNGWVFLKPGGRYVTDYIQGALVTRFGLGCNIEEDAVYPTVTTDSAGQKLDGANKYVMRFPTGGRSWPGQGVELAAGAEPAH